ncbi:hypothetical protein J6590_047553 [Homalodisca vitripennis]|nr:hypothetical protein J6590_047553 [Homalodisca vitripennis]
MKECLSNLIRTDPNRQLINQRRETWEPFLWAATTSAGSNQYFDEARVFLPGRRNYSRSIDEWRPSAGASIKLESGVNNGRTHGQARGRGCDSPRLGGDVCPGRQITGDTDSRAGIDIAITRGDFIAAAENRTRLSAIIGIRGGIWFACARPWDTP